MSVMGCQLWLFLEKIDLNGWQCDILRLGGIYVSVIGISIDLGDNSLLSVDAKTSSKKMLTFCELEP